MHCKMQIEKNEQLTTATKKNTQLAREYIFGHFEHVFLKFSAQSEFFCAGPSKKGPAAPRPRGDAAGHLRAGYRTPSPQGVPQHLKEMMGLKQTINCCISLLSHHSKFPESRRQMRAMRAMHVTRAMRAMCAGTAPWFSAARSCSFLPSGFTSRPSLSLGPFAFGGSGRRGGPGHCGTYRDGQSQPAASPPNRTGGGVQAGGKDGCTQQTRLQQKTATKWKTLSGSGK